MTAIEVDKLCFSYGGLPVLDRVRFAIPKGAYAALIGPNGAGKSTLLRLLLGELTPAGGELLLFENAVRTFRDWQKIGYVPQAGLNGYAAFPATVGEVVCANLYLQRRRHRLTHRLARERVRRALELTGTAEFEKRLIGALSGGQRQRVLLARALVSEPELLILDEPMTGVDARSAASFRALLKNLNQNDGLTILLVTHDVRTAARDADQVLCLEEGSLVGLTPEQLQEELAHRHAHPLHMTGEGDEDDAV